MLKLLVACLAAALFAAPAAADQTVRYDIKPALRGGALTALAVEMRFEGDHSGVTRLSEPAASQEGPAKGAQLPPDLVDLQVTGAVMSPGGDHELVLHHAPGAAIVVRYNLVSGYTALPGAQPGRALLLVDWFYVHGERAFVRPEGRDEAAATVRFDALPPGWIAASDLNPGQGVTVGDLEDRIFFGGAGWRELDRPLGAARLRFFYRTGLAPAKPEATADLVARIAMAGFDYWADPPQDEIVPVIPLSHDESGRGTEQGFLYFAAAGSDLSGLRHEIAHELEHNWTSRQIGGFPKTDPDLEAWLNEGFTELTSDRYLLRSGLWSLSDFVDGLNTSLFVYGASPVRDAPNSRIGAGRFSDDDIGHLPYDRGRLLGLLWDGKFRAATGGRVGLQDVLQHQRQLARAAKADGQTTSADLLLPIAAREAAGVDLTADIAHYVRDGGLITLPADLFGDCGRFVSLTQPVFDRGFDIMATLRNDHRLVGLEPGGPAERAGLREGDRIHVDEGVTNNSQIPLTYKIDQPDGSQRTITFKPEGAAQVTLQQFHLNPSLDAASQARCRTVMSGGA